MTMTIFELVAKTMCMEKLPYGEFDALTNPQLYAGLDKVLSWCVVEFSKPGREEQYHGFISLLKDLSQPDKLNLSATAAAEAGVRHALAAKRHGTFCHRDYFKDLLFGAVVSPETIDALVDDMSMKDMKFMVVISYLMMKMPRNNLSELMRSMDFVQKALQSDTVVDRGEVKEKFKDMLTQINRLKQVLEGTDNE